MQKMLSLVRRAVDHYHMIEEGDRIAVGVSGGKDSLTLLTALAELRRFYPKKFEVIAITLEMGYNDILRDNCISKARYVRLKEYDGFPQFEIITSTICPICGENEVFENEVPFCEKCVKNIGFYDEFDEDDDEEDDE